MTAARQRLTILMGQTAADEVKYHDWTYDAVRPLGVPPSWRPGQHVVGDCSKGVQYLCRWAQAPDPMGDAFGPYGNSQTMWAVLSPLATAAEMEPGDIVLFGLDGRDHAAMVYQAGADPMLWSFGHQGAPNFYRLSADPRIRYFRRLMHDVPPVPPQVTKLRAETGFYAWVAWRLGEGDWKTYGPHNAKVRPNVPRVIPADWWKRYLRFLANRKRGNAATTG